MTCGCVDVWTCGRARARGLLKYHARMASAEERPADAAVAALEADSKLAATPEGRRAVSLLVSGGKSFLWDLTVGSVRRVVGSAALWSIGFLVVGLIFQLSGVSTDVVGGLFKVVGVALVVVLFPLAGVVCGVFWGLYRSLMRQVEAVERAVQTAVNAVLAKVQEASDAARAKVGEALGVEQFTAMLDGKIDELVHAAAAEQRGFGRRLARRLSTWMLSRLLRTVRAVIVRSFLAGRERVSIAQFAQFMQEKAFGLVLEQVKQRVRLLRLVPLAGLALFVALPLLMTLL